MSDLLEIMQTDKVKAKRLRMLINDIIRSPYDGIGKPEPLKHELSGYWSRRVDDADRIVYKVENDTITVVAVKGHYNG
jgi:toxin YoeB